MRHYLAILLVLAAPIFAKAQSVGINTQPATSAALDVVSTSKGMLVPRVTTSQRTAIASPAKGLLVYDSSLNNFYYHNGSAWTQVGGGISSSATPTSFYGSGTIAASNTNGNGTFYANFANGASASETDAHRLLLYSANTVTLNIVAAGSLSSSYTVSLRRGTNSSGFTYTDLGATTVTLSGTTSQTITFTNLGLSAGETIGIKIVGTAAFNATGQQKTIIYSLAAY